MHVATKLSRLEFRQSYPRYSQGLFILTAGRRLPKDQPELNIGRIVSATLADVAREQWPGKISGIVLDAVREYRSVSLTHIEVLFTPTLRVNAVLMLLSLCRNRKLCLLWPGTMQSDSLVYGTPDIPEFYECDLKNLRDTYIVTE